MAQINETTQGVLDQISEGFAQKGAYNLRQNGVSICHGDSEHIKIRKKEDKPGIDILIDGDTKGERVFIPVVVSVSGMTDLVYNDFYIADGADVTIVAGCGIHNSGCNESRHDGIHTFHVGKNANGSGSSAQIVSRSVGKGESSQVFHPKAVGNAKCHAHIQCDSIIMDHARVGSIPEIQANHVDAAIVHEAAIGRINDEQLLKLRTLGMTEAEAENVIIENFLS